MGLAHRRLLCLRSALEKQQQKFLTALLISKLLGPLDVPAQESGTQVKLRGDCTHSLAACVVDPKTVLRSSGAAGTPSSGVVTGDERCRQYGLFFLLFRGRDLSAAWMRHSKARCAPKGEFLQHSQEPFAGPPVVVCGLTRARKTPSCTHSPKYRAILGDTPCPVCACFVLAASRSRGRSTRYLIQRSPSARRLYCFQQFRGRFFDGRQLDVFFFDGKSDLKANCLPSNRRLEGTDRKASQNLELQEVSRTPPFFLAEGEPVFRVQPRQNNLRRLN